MAVSRPTSLTPTEEKADCFRLLALVVDGGSLVLRHQFDQVFPPNNLENELKDPQTRTKLNHLFKKKILSKSQFGLLYPTVGQPCSEKFDITLLVCLLRYICGLDDESASWKGKPLPSDITTEADISRLKHNRNEISHLKSISLNKYDFQRKWDKLEQVITRLGKGIPTLQRAIKNLKENSIDPVKEKFYQDTIEEWRKMDDVIKEDIIDLKAEVQNSKETIEEVKLKAEHNTQAIVSLEQKQQEDTEHVVQKLHAMEVTLADVEETTLLYSRDSSTNTYMTTVTDLYVEDTERDAIYVTTKTHKLAEEKFGRTWCVILSGLPGEGKTTMATKLISETTKKGFARKLNSPSDWKSIPLNTNTPVTIFIDDIFGAGALNDRLLEGWSDILPDIEKAIKARAVKAIITTRHYIFKEAKERLKHLKILSEDNVQMLASHDLSDDERKEILKKHLIRSNREFDTKMLESCNCEYKHNSYRSYGVPPDFQYFASMIGFPEIVDLFVKSEHLFSEGSYFFGEPYLFFKKCIEEICLDKEKFLPLLLVWTRPHKKLKIADIEPPNISEAIKETVTRFGFELCRQTTESIYRSLLWHEDGFLLKNSYDGTIEFSHNSVKDMVGLVAGQEYKSLVLQFADIEFLKRFITTDVRNDDSLHIFIEQFRYGDLNKTVCKLMTENTKRSFKLPDNKIRDKFASFPSRNNKYKSFVESSLVEHDSFEQRSFVRMFCESEGGSQMLSRSVECLPSKCFDEFCDLDFGEEAAVYLPTLALLYKRPLLIEEVLMQNFEIINEAGFLKTSLIIASQFGYKNIIAMLLHHVAIVNHDAIFLASANGNGESLDFMLQNFSGNCTKCPNSINANSPLIAAAKRGDVQCANSLIGHGATINYRNKNGWSALDKAAMYAKQKSCKILLENNADVCNRTNKYKRTTLHLSANAGDVAVTRMLLEYSALLTTKDYRGHYPVHCAAFSDNVEVVDILLKADLSHKTHDQRVSYGKKSTVKGATLFHIAVLKQSVKLIGCLLQNNICPNVRDFYGRTPLYIAVYGYEQKIETVRRSRTILKEMSQKQQFDVVKKLSEHADAHIPDYNGYTPLHAAVHKGQLELVKLLAPLSDVNAQDKYGKTPLHTSCDKMDFHTFKILVEDYKADYCMRTKAGHTIFDILAKRTKWRNIRRRYQSKQRVTKYMVEYPRFQSFREIIEIKDPAFVTEVTKKIVLSEHPRDKLFKENNALFDELYTNSLEFYSYLD